MRSLAQKRDQTVKLVDGLVKKALRSLHRDLPGWYRREQEVVSLFAFGHLVPLMQKKVLIWASSASKAVCGKLNPRGTLNRIGSDVTSTNTRIGISCSLANDAPTIGVHTIRLRRIQSPSWNGSCGHPEGLKVVRQLDVTTRLTCCG